jgi:flagellar motor switch protein FliN/FliY
MMTEPGKTVSHEAASRLRNASESGGLQPAVFEELSDTPAAQTADRDLNLVLDLPVQVMVELGRTRISIAELLSFRRGSVIELNVKAGDPLDLVVNGCLIAQGEVVIVNNQYGIRLTDIVSPSERLRRTSR